MRILTAAMAAILTVFLTSSCSLDSGPAPIRRYSRTVLDVPHLDQEPMLCVPTSAAMVLSFYGNPTAPRLLKSLAGGQYYDPNASFTDFTITSYDGIIRAMASLGYGWTQRTFANDETGFRKGLELIEAELRAGHPVLVDATLPSGHTFVIRGFDTDEQELFTVDPNEAAPGQREISFDNFKSVWNETAYGNDFRSMIVTQPRSTG